MKTYLLTWNPKRWPWKNLAETSAETLAGQGVIGSWSCGNTKSIQPGDRIFLMRVSEGPKGIIGSGFMLIAKGIAAEQRAIVAPSASYGVDRRQIFQAPAGATEDHDSTTRLFRPMRGLNCISHSVPTVGTVGCYRMLLRSFRLWPTPSPIC